MGWAFCGSDNEGREIGYGVEAICDHKYCSAKINRGLAYVCGGMHGGGAHGCGRYFCGDHLGWAGVPDLGCPSEGQLCAECAAKAEARFPDLQECEEE